MTRDDITRMAREAGLAPICSACDEPNFNYAYEDWDEELTRFAALVRADEREACAKLADSMRDKTSRYADYLGDVGEAIRSRT